MEAEWPVPGEPAPVEDEAAVRMECLHVRPHGNLDPIQRKGVELDYGMKDGELRIPVAAALENYLRSRLRLPLKGEGGEDKEIRHLELAE